jgi:hypothetical protein
MVRFTIDNKGGDAPLDEIRLSTKEIPAVGTPRAHEILLSEDPQARLRGSDPRPRADQRLGLRESPMSDVLP